MDATHTTRNHVAAQLAYYFSPTNLAQDAFLRRAMDPRSGYLPIELLATFKRLRAITTDLELIVDVLKADPNLQVHENSVRKRDWQMWVLAPSDAAARPPQIERPPSHDPFNYYPDATHGWPQSAPTSCDATAHMHQGMVMPPPQALLPQQVSPLQQALPPHSVHHPSLDRESFYGVPTHRRGAPPPEAWTAPSPQRASPPMACTSPHLAAANGPPPSASSSRRRENAAKGAATAVEATSRDPCATFAKPAAAKPAVAAAVTKHAAAATDTADCSAEAALAALEEAEVMAAIAAVAASEQEERRSSLDMGWMTPSVKGRRRTSSKGASKGVRPPTESSIKEISKGAGNWEGMHKVVDNDHSSDKTEDIGVGDWSCSNSSEESDPSARASPRESTTTPPLQQRSAPCNKSGARKRTTTSSRATAQQKLTGARACCAAAIEPVVDLATAWANTSTTVVGSLCVKLADAVSAVIERSDTLRTRSQQVAELPWSSMHMQTLILAMAALLLYLMPSGGMAAGHVPALFDYASRYLELPCALGLAIALPSMRLRSA